MWIKLLAENNTVSGEVGSNTESKKKFHKSLHTHTQWIIGGFRSIQRHLFSVKIIRNVSKVFVTRDVNEETQASNHKLAV